MSLRFMPSAQTSSGSPSGPKEIYLGVAITENVHMGRLMIVDEDDHLQAGRAQTVIMKQN
jgi:hypothetical protein